MSLAYRANADFAKLNHPMRVPLSAEIHSRPFLQLQAPESLTHFALYLQQDQPSRQNHRASQHQILERQGIRIDRSCLADWVGRSAFALKPIVARMLELLKRSAMERP